MSFIIRKAKRKNKKLRIGLSAASGFGKTYSSLLLAKGILEGDLSKCCVIDSENDSASLYDNLGEYSTIALHAPYTPERYIEAITAAEQAGFEVIIVDSITHEWEGDSGCLEIHSKLGGKYQDWAKVTPRHNAFINKILTSSSHIITTVRRKQDYEMSSVNGKTTVTKVGTKEVTRDGFEYELDINFEVTNDKHLVVASKDRTQLFVNKPEFLITEETGEILMNWAKGGTSLLDDALEMVRDSKTIDQLTDVFKSYPELKANEDLINACKARKQFLTETV